MLSNMIPSKLPLRFGAAIISSIFVCAAYSGIAAAADNKISLTDEQEVLLVKSAGHGTATITVNADRSISGSVKTTNLNGTEAHIHEAALGRNGSVIIPLKKEGDTYSVPAGAKLTIAQFASYQAGKLYVNVHSLAYPNGEIRGQLKP